MPQNRPVTIDVDAIAASKFPGKKIPGWILSLVKKIVHQDFLNVYFSQGKIGVDFAPGAVEYLGVKLKVEGEENIPSEGRFTFVSNHPLGGIDAISEIAFVGTKYNGDMYIPANDFLSSLKQIDEYIVPINKTGGQSRQLGEKMDEAFSSDRQILIFPAGMCSRKFDGKIQDAKWKKTFLTKSKEFHRDIIPMWFSGRNSKRFYFIDGLCKKLGIKTNIAMFFLPDELYRGRNKEYTLRIGKPIPWQTFTDEKKDVDWAAYVREKVYELED
ncbi:MAG: 1-acyl-sn-glycerol-3-phosphate acyltransferase [Bacteroidales bacterium]|nr:1-acyl-sn-glycerol-3-phosphate acyltransferase [Bacteroidales bacterium]